MSIEYVEIRNPQREIIGICDAFNSIIWRPEYYGTGDFEIYAPCSPLNLSLYKRMRAANVPFQPWLPR